MKKIVHTGIYGIIKRNEEILLVNKSRGPYKNLFDLPGGRIENDETNEEALVREVKEETGIVPGMWYFVKQLHHKCCYKINKQKIDFRHKGIIFWIDEYDDSMIDYGCPSEDSNGCEWRSIHENELFSPFAKMISEHLFSTKPKPPLRN